MSKQIEVPKLIGARIVSIRQATPTDMNKIVGFQDHEPAMIIKMDNGIEITALKDPEGNGMGAVIGIYKNSQFYLQPE